MQNQHIHNISRRSFFKNAGLLSGCLILAVYLPSCSPKDSKMKKNTKDDGILFQPNLFVQMTTDGYLVLLAARSEMGQGIRTAITSIIADEMEADWEYVSVIQGDGDAKYGNQNTDGSRSIKDFFVPMRELGATVKALLIKCAAEKWQVPISECNAENHFVHHKNSNQKIFYGELAEAASKMEVPTEFVLKDPKDFKYIGKNLKSIDVKDFTRGIPKFGMDIKLPNMKYATIQRCPVTFGTVKSFQKEKAMTVKGVSDIFEMKRVEKPFGPLGGVVVVADNTWSAMKAQKEITVEWSNGNNEIYDSEMYKKQLIDSVTKPGKVVKNIGDVNDAFKAAETIVEAQYYLPHLAHAPMEVPNATANVVSDKCEVWAPVQDPQTAREEVSQYLGIPLENVTIHVTFLGGGFGRKSKPDYVVEAAAISKQINGPVQLVWSREDDIRHGYYHTVNAQYIKASLDKSGKVSGWLHRTAFPTIMSTFAPGSDYAADWEVGQGVTKNAFQIPNVLCENGKAPNHVRIGWLRSVLDAPHCFGLNAFTDELAHAAKKDSLDFFLELIGDDREEDFGGSTPFFTQRLKHVLRTAAKNAEWGKQMPKGHGQGLAVHYSFQSYVASVVEVSVIDNKLKVHSVHTVIDCGTAVNKSSIKAQMEGSAVFGISTVLHGKITAKNGAIEQSNFHDYNMARMKDSPLVEVEIIENNEKPTGVGEPGLPVIAPAIINAVFKATGTRYRELPLSNLA